MLERIFHENHIDMVFLDKKDVSPPTGPKLGLG